jgi:putative transposase
MDGDPLADRKCWVHDNDGKFQTLAGLLKSRGKTSVNTAVRAPDMNACAERFIRSAREECLDHIAFLTEDHLRSTLCSYIDHYNTERPHQGLGNVTIGPWQAQDHGEIVCDTRLNGLLVSFRRAA